MSNSQKSPPAPIKPTGLTFQTPQGKVKETTQSFTPDLSPASIAERGTSLGTDWTGWYDGYSAGQRRPNDAQQIKRWHGFRTRHVPQFKNNPTPRRAAALISWGIDPSKLLAKAKQKAFEQKMDAYFQQRKTSLKSANMQSLSHLGMNVGLNQGMKLPNMSTKFTQTNTVNKGVSNPFKSMPLSPSTAGSGPLTNNGLKNLDGFVRPDQVNFASLSRSTPFGTGKMT
jgi:hypothetical protein